MRGKLARVLRKMANYKPDSASEKYVLAQRSEDGLPFICLDPRGRRKYYRNLKRAVMINKKTGERYI